ncbi:MAG: F-box protein [Candidatus Phytoplasma australasiaticum]|nr:F-box protein [Candidatus Phytoplasma australasiaticum]
MEAKSAMINNLPPHIIETILSVLPIKEAARTSILCREWKYHWTKIPKLKFVAKDIKVSINDDEVEERLSQADRELFYDINHVMSIHQGPIHEFSLFAHAHGSCVEIDHFK